METVKGIKIPLEADSVLSPDVCYGDRLTGIYFRTEDDHFGRITFYNLDALKICRGEMMPYKYNWATHESGVWIFKIENSKWLIERYEYEHKHYGSSYEFGGNVNEMLTDFSHYLFSFHDQFVEVIAKGFWFEKDTSSLFQKPLQTDHPFLNIETTNATQISAHYLTCQVWINPKPTHELVSNAMYCPQKLIEFALELEGKASVDHTLILTYRNGKVVSTLNGYFGKQQLEFEGVATLQDVQPYIEAYMAEVYNRRKKMGE